MMTDVIVQIMIEVLLVLAIATKQVKQGRFSKYTTTYTLTMAQMCHREICQKTVGGQRG
jgi:hypothetical protein